jgi:hypothetical protein
MSGIARDHLIMRAIRDMAGTGAIVRRLTGHHILPSDRYIVHQGIVRRRRDIGRL